jgi:hypothetical protein
MHASRAERYTAPGAVQVVDARARHKGVLLLDVRPVEAPRESPAGLPWTDRRSEAKRSCLSAVAHAQKRGVRRP